MRLSNRKTSRGSDIELSMTSMIDVVFLLLIFFMTTSSFVKTERELDSGIKVKSESSAKRPDDMEPAIVKITPAGEGFVFEVGANQFTDQAALTELLKRLPNTDAGAFVQAGDGVPFHMIAAAVQACKDANFRPVSYVPLD